MSGYEKDFGIFPRFEKYCIEDRKIWFITDFGNCLYEYEMGSSSQARILCVIPIPRKHSMKRIPAGAIVKCGSKIVIAPYMDESFYVYDLAENKLAAVPCRVTGDYKFGAGLCHGDDILFIGSGKPVIARFHTKDNTVQYLDAFQEEALSYGMNGRLWSRGSCCMVDNRLFVTSMGNPYLLEYAVEEGSYRFCRIENINGGFNNILQAGGYIWLIPRQAGPVVRWDYVNGETAQIESAHCFIPRVSQYSQVSSRFLWIMDARSLELYVVDTQKMDMREATLPICEKVGSYEDKRIGNRLLWMHGTGHSLLLYFYDSSLIYEIDDESMEINTYDIAFPDEYLKEAYEMGFGQREIPVEGGYGFFSAIDVFLRYALRDGLAAESAGSQCGQRIHSEIMDGIQ